MEFIKPKPVFNDGFDNLSEYNDLVKVKIYTSGMYYPDEYKTSGILLNKYKEFEKYTFDHRFDIIGELVSAAGKIIRNIELIECINKKRGYVNYLNKTAFTRPVNETIDYEMYTGFKFKMKDNHLYQWFAREEIEQFNAPVPQQLDDEGYIVMVEDLKNHVVVNYGNGLIQQEMKEVYCSVNGRYIKYKGKNYYIKEV